MNLNNNNITALVTQYTPKNSSKIYQLFPINNRLKYPITFNVLLNRINTLINHFNLKPIFKIYINCELNEKFLRKELKSIGGIYLWWCRVTGKFYVGSAKNFTGGKYSRLVDYYQTSRLNKELTSYRVSQDLASDKLLYPKQFWNLIILEVCENPIDLDYLKSREQFWMLLNPTYNRSLVVGSPSRGPIPENQRRAKSSAVYVYTVENDKIVIGSELVIMGIKETVRQLNIYLADFQAHLNSGLLYNNQYLFFKSPLSIELQEKWAPVKSSFLKEGKTTAVWIYSAKSLEFIEKLDRVIDARNKYNVSKTTMGRCLKHNIPYNKFLFSRNKIH